MTHKDKRKFLAIIPARYGSKRIPGKNIKSFCGKPLIYYSIKVAIESGIFDRVIVDTDSKKIAKIAIKYGAEVPCLRPAELAEDNSKIGDVVVFLLKRLKKEQGYKPDAISLLQTTSPLRELSDLMKCFEVMSDNRIKSVCTVCETSPWFLNLSSKKRIFLINQETKKSTNTQDVPMGYAFNGCMVYMVKTAEFLKTKKFVDIDNKGETVGVICPKWRSVDLDNKEDWIMAEFLYKNKKRIEKQLNHFK